MVVLGLVVWEVVVMVAIGVCGRLDVVYVPWYPDG